MIWFACRWVVVVPYSNESSKHGTRWPNWSSFFPLFFAKEAEKNHVRTFDVLFWNWEAWHLHFSTSSTFGGNENGWCFWKVPKWMIAMVRPDAQCTRESYVRVGPAWSFCHANSKNRMCRVLLHACTNGYSDRPVAHYTFAGFVFAAHTTTPYIRDLSR
jgi:hypothetical protein